MRSLLITIVLFSTFSAIAAEVPGQIFYSVKNGELAKRDVTLQVPTRGQGEVILKGSQFEWKTTNFWTTRSANGEVLFTAAFQTEFMGEKSTIALKGTYLKANNEIIYNGNFYKRKDHNPVNKDISDFNYNGGFTFNYSR